MNSLDLEKLPSYPKTQQQLDEIKPLLAASFLTKNLSDEMVNKIAGAMQPKHYKQGDQIIKYGDVGQHYYILSQGSVKVIVYQPKTDPNDPELATKVTFTKVMEKGAGFGELALIYNDKRSATIEALEDCQCYALDGTVFKSIVIKSSMQKRAQLAGFLNSIKLFDSLDQQKKLKLVDGL